MGRSRRMILTLSAVMAAICFSSCRIAEIRQIPSVADVATPAAYILLFENPAKGEIFAYGDAGLADFRFPPCSTFKIVSTLTAGGWRISMRAWGMTAQNTSMIHGTGTSRFRRLSAFPVCRIIRN